MKLKVVIIALWVLVLLLPASFVVGSVIQQFDTITIEGKGDSGRERSLEYPFICYERGSFTDRRFYNHCNAGDFVRGKWLTFQLLMSGELQIFRPVKIYQVYAWILVFLIPTTIYIVCKKE